ncbi:MAG: hypothetical protein EHM40_09880 [Chloroflexi bacterium]|nr:MAG: hypothetical protein EHM40_09880 [Chloroflexota bacterium]
MNTARENTIICQFCGASHEAFQPTCPACGAPVRVGQNKVIENSETKTIAEIRRYRCDHLRMHFIHEFQVGTSIPEKKLQIIKNHSMTFQKEKKFIFIVTQALSRMGNKAL